MWWVSQRHNYGLRNSGSAVQCTLYIINEMQQTHIVTIRYSATQFK